MIFYLNNQPLDKDLTIVEKDDPVAHIKYGGPGSTDNNDSSNGNNTRIPGVNDGTVEDIMPEVVLTPPIINLPAMPMPVPGFVFAI